LRNQFINSAAIALFLVFGSQNAAAEFDHKHELWNSIVSRYVSADGSTSVVDYKTLKEDAREPLTKYLDTLASVPESKFNSWTKRQRLAFLINAYNAWTIKLIVDNYPIKSIKDIGGFLSSPWKQKIVQLFGDKRSLDWIEHEKIRPTFNEPRIHFALVCASKGCPGLRSEAFTPDKLDQQLEGSTKRFLADGSRNSFNLQKKELNLSSLFKWYKDDFVKARGSVEKFVLPYMTKAGQAANTEHFIISYKDYDWSLNENHNSSR